MDSGQQHLGYKTRMDGVQIYIGRKNALARNGFERSPLDHLLPFEIWKEGECRKSRIWSGKIQADDKSVKDASLSGSGGHATRPAK